MINHSICQATELQLEEMRGAALHGIVVILQKNVRRWIAVRRFKIVRKCVVRMQACVRRQNAVRKYEKMRRAVIVIQAFFRMVCKDPVSSPYCEDKFDDAIHFILFYFIRIFAHALRQIKPRKQFIAVRDEARRVRALEREVCLRILDCTKYVL